MTQRAAAVTDMPAPAFTPLPSNQAEHLLRGITALAADAVVSTDDQFRIMLFNPAAERMFGRSVEDVLGEPLGLLLPESAREAHRGHLERFRHSTMDSRHMSDRGRVWGRRKSGELFPAEASISKLTVDGATFFTAVLRDVTEERHAEQEREVLLAREHESRTAAEVAQRRMTFLASASEILHSSLAVEETFDALLRVIIPQVAVCCVVDIVDATGRIRRAHVVHGDPAMQAFADRLGGYPSQQTRYLTRRAIAEGRAELGPAKLESGSCEPFRQYPPTLQQQFGFIAKGQHRGLQQPPRCGDADGHAYRAAQHGHQGAVVTRVR